MESKMGSFSGPQLVSDGLILDLDVSSRKSLISSAGSQESLINTSDWILGTGGTAIFPMNGLTAENQRIAAIDPWGYSNIVWGTYPSGDGGADGGWDSTYVAADKTKTYRYSMWVRRTSSTSGGTFYFGLYTNGTGNTFNIANSVSETNPYWDYRGAGALTQDQWYLVVGFIHPHTYTGTTAHPDSGYYTISNGVTKISNNAGNVPNGVKFPSDATTLMSRAYHYYCNDSTTRLQFAYPRIDLIDGNEPTISELLNKNPGVLHDQSGRSNHHQLTPYYVPVTDSPRKFVLDGATHGFSRSSALAGASSTCTVVIWYSTTDSAELWVRGNQTNSVYLSASSGNNYYHAGCGSPVNYVDLKSVTNPVTEGYRNDVYHMWEAKSVDFSSWTYFEWFRYPAPWQLSGNVSKILVYNKNLSTTESAQNFAALRGRFSI